MFSDPLDANLYDFDLVEEDGPTYLDEDAEPTLEELIEPEELDALGGETVCRPTTTNTTGSPLRGCANSSRQG